MNGTAVALFDGADLVVRYADDAFCRLLARDRAALVGRPLEDAFPESRASGIAAMLDTVRRTGLPAIAADVPGGAVDGAPGHQSVTVWPLAGGERLLGLVVELFETAGAVGAGPREASALVELREVNQQLLIAGLRERELAREAEAAGRRAAFLADASARLVASLDYEATLAAVAQLAVPAVADWCMVNLVEGDRVFRPVAVAYADPAKAGLARAFKARVFPIRTAATYGVSKVLVTGEAEVSPDVSDELLQRLAHDAEHLALLRAIGARSAMRVPLVARGRVLGAISFVTAESGRRYGPADLLVGEELGRRAALSIDNARLYRETQDALRARDAFLARASHELRTPLTSALGTMRLLARAIEGRLEESPAELVAIGLRNLDAMLALINNLLDASRLAAQGAPPVLAPVELAPAVSRAVDVVGAQAREKGVRLAAAVPPGLAVAAEPIGIEQLLVNLLANGVKFTPAGGAVAVEAEVEAGGANVVVRVRDTGEGLAAEHLDRVFEPFFQVAPGGARRAKGSGLGLAICRQIVALHGGVIWAESDGLGRGSTFNVRLPAAGTGGDRAA